MKKLLLAVVFLVIFSMGVIAQDNGNITIINETGYMLNYIYFSPSAFDDWGDDFLGGDVLEDGEELKILLDREIDKDEMIYDLQAVDEDDDYYTIYETDVSVNRELRITMENYDGGDYDDGGDYGSSDFSGYEEGYNDGYTEGYKEGYKEAFRDAYLEGFRAAMDMDKQEYGNSSSDKSSSSSNWR